MSVAAWFRARVAERLDVRLEALERADDERRLGVADRGRALGPRARRLLGLVEVLKLLLERRQRHGRGRKLRGAGRHRVENGEALREQGENVRLLELEDDACAVSSGHGGRVGKLVGGVKKVFDGGETSNWAFERSRGWGKRWKGQWREMEGRWRRLERAFHELESPRNYAWMAFRQLKRAWREPEGSHRDVKGVVRGVERSPQELEASFQEGATHLLALWSSSSARGAHVTAHQTVYVSRAVSCSASPACITVLLLLRSLLAVARHSGQALGSVRVSRRLAVSAANLRADVASFEAVALMKGDSDGEAVCEARALFLRSRVLQS